ncbi:MAG TPA: aspartyl protease family protein [Planctomycetota bacterium]|nr:aspartyl protease family protein [Planctomycetota bacterium]
MKRLLLIVLLAGCGGSARGAASGGDLDAALDACARGDFPAAEAMLKDKKDAASIRLRARILMMRNRNREAIELLLPLFQGKVKSYEGVEEQSQVLPELAIAYVRQDDFLNASKVYGMLGEAVIAKKYEALGRKVAYSTNLGVDEVSVDFQLTEPLAVVSATVNGQRGLFVIDTMLDQIVLDREFARRAAVDALGVRGAGNVDEATVLEVSIGQAKVKNVPVHLGEWMEIGRMRVDGMIGLQFLMHFDFTLDYRRSRLTLRKPGAAIKGEPGYLVGDRYLLTGGQLNGTTRTFVAIGTALKGVTLAASELFPAADVKEFAACGVKLAKPLIDPKAFPAGLEGSFGIPIAFVMGPGALRGKVFRVDPASMRIAID